MWNNGGWYSRWGYSQSGTNRWDHRGGCIPASAFTTPVDYESDLSNADLRGAELSNADLSNADLSGAELRDADLRNADLSGANLFDANLDNTDLRNVYLNGAFSDTWH